MTDAGIHWFPGLGFRPAVWTPPYRADGVDPPRLVPSPDADVPMIAKVPPMDPWDHMPAAGYAWGTWIPAPATGAPQVTAASLAGPIPRAPVYVRPGTPGTWLPGSGPDHPCHCIVTPPPPGPELPPIAPVPLSASGLMLVTAVVALLIAQRRSHETA